MLMRLAYSRLATLRKRFIQTETSLSTADCLEKWFLAAVLWVMVSGWLALLLGELGLFSLPLLAALEVVLVSVVAVVKRRSFRSLGLLPLSLSVYDLILLMGLVLASAYYARPFEYILGAFDPGVYVNTGALMARTGSIVAFDADYLALPPDLRDALFRNPDRPAMFDRRLQMFSIQDAERGMVTGHGLHLYPSLLAIGYSLGGIWAELLVTPVIALLSVLALYLLAKRLFGPPVGLLAALFLVLNVAEAWFARYPVAETPVQFFLLSGFLALALMVDTGKPPFGLAAGLLFGAVHLTKIEQVFVPVVIAGFLAYEVWQRRFGRQHAYLIVAYSVVSLHAILHAWLFARPYSAAQFANLLEAFSRRGGMAALAILSAVGLIVISLGLWHGMRRLRPALAAQVTTRFSPSARMALVLGVCLLAVYAYYVRPLGSSPGVALWTLPGDVIYDITNRQSLIRLGWYVTPLGLLLGVMGCVIAIGDASRRTGALIALVLVDSVWSLYDSMATPCNYWVARRWLPMVMPGFALFGGHLLVWLGRRLGWHWPDVLLPVGLSLVVIMSLAGANLPLLRHIEHEGAVQQVCSFASQFPEQSVILYEDQMDLERLSTPVQYLFERTSFVVWKDTKASSAVAEAVRFWEGNGRPVYWVARAQVDGPDQGTVAVPGLRLTYLYDFHLDVPEAECSFDARPAAVIRLQMPLRVYQATAQR